MDNLEEVRREKRLLRKRAYYAANKERLLANQTARRDANREALRLKAAEYYRNNRAKCIASVKRYERKNPEKAYERKRRWGSANKFRYAEITARKLAERLNAIPSWADEFVIREFYELGFLRTKLTGVKHHVDHIVPLRSDLVCGLHCEANLQVIPEICNIKKSNRHWPDMPT